MLENLKEYIKDLRKQRDEFGKKIECFKERDPVILTYYKERRLFLWRLIIDLKDEIANEEYKYKHKCPHCDNLIDINIKIERHLTKVGVKNENIMP